MTPGTTKRPAAPVALGAAVELVAEPDSVFGVVVDWTTETEVLTVGEPVAIKMEDSEPGKVEAVRVLLPTTIGTTGALVGTSVVDGTGATELETGVFEVVGPTGVVDGSSETLTVTEVPTGTIEVVGTTTTGVLEAGTMGAVEASVGGQ